MSLSIYVLVDDGDIREFETYFDIVSRRIAREELLPILKDYLRPMVESEKSFLASHSKSGALEGSLSARSGSGDRGDTISAFSAPSATNALIQSTWGLRGRAQQKGWAQRTLKFKGRRKVFYGPIVHQGHRVVKRNAAGELYDTGKKTQPVPFAQQAVDSMGETQAESAADAVLTKIMEG